MSIRWQENEKPNLFGFERKKVIKEVNVKDRWIQERSTIFKKKIVGMRDTPENKPSHETSWQMREKGEIKDSQIFGGNAENGIHLKNTSFLDCVNKTHR